MITPDGSPSMQEYRKKVLEDLVQKKSVSLAWHAAVDGISKSNRVEWDWNWLTVRWRS